VQLIIFEDEAYRNFFPLTLTRPVYELRAGTSTIREKLMETLGKKDEKTILLCRGYLSEILEEKNPNFLVNRIDKIEDDVLLVNGLLIPDNKTIQVISEKLSDKRTLLMKNGRIAAAYMDGKALEEEGISVDNITSYLIKTASKKIETSDITLLDNPWELVKVNGELIIDEFRQGEWQGEVDERATIYGDRSRIFIGENTYVEAGVVLDARKGPIHIGSNTYVENLTKITGPAYVGNNCIVFGAQIRPGCSIGDVCRVGGEVEETIFQGYSNKRHYGYIGHSYIGEWINLGAGTTNSDLKNTYGTVKVSGIDTGRIFVGCFMGDHVKTAIGTMIYSGKKIGVSAHLYGTITSDVPSFTAYAKSLGIEAVEIYLDSAIKTAERAMKRRNINLSKAYEKMLRRVFELTAEERREAGVSRGKFKL